MLVGHSGSNLRIFFRVRVKCYQLPVFTCTWSLQCTSSCMWRSVFVLHKNLKQQNIRNTDVFSDICTSSVLKIFFRCLSTNLPLLKVHMWSQWRQRETEPHIAWENFLKFVAGWYFVLVKWTIITNCLSKNCFSRLPAHSGIKIFFYKFMC